MQHPDGVPPIAVERAQALAALPGVRAVALGGSRVTGAADDASDVDLEVYADDLPPLESREALILPNATRAEIGNDFFGLGGEWVERDGTVFDVVWWTPRWIEEQLDRVLVRHEAEVGYSTAFWHSVRSCRILVDPTGWLTDLQQRAAAPYPEPLRRAVVEKNRAVLRGGLSSFDGQLARAVRRDDPVSVQHRSAAALASVFDVLLAVNRMPHPGEKRLLQHVDRLCPLQPEGFAGHVRAVIESAGRPGAEVVDRLDALVDALDVLLREEGLLV